MKLELSRIKLGVVLSSALLQACALGALLESTVEVQPVLKSPEQSQVLMNAPTMANQPVLPATQGPAAPVFVPPTQVDTIQETHSARQMPSVGAPLPPAAPVMAPVPQQVYTAPVMAPPAMPPQPLPQRTLSSGGMYLQIGMFRSVSGARQVKANAQAATDVPVSINDDRAEQYRVLVGPFPQRDLPKVRSQLDQAGFSYFRFTR